MKNMTNIAAQGDILIMRVDSIPVGFMPKKPTDNQHIVAHSKTGHHHVIDADEVDYFTSDSAEGFMKAFIEVKNILGAQLEHLRSFDTHETIHIPPGIYELRRQREYQPEGWRRVED